MKSQVLKAMDVAYLFCIWISGAAIFFMSLLIPIGVFARYVLGVGAQWPEPISILLMVVFTFFGSAASYRAGAHIAVAMLTDRLPTAWRAPCATVVDLLMGAVCVFTIIWGGKLALETMGQTLAEIPWMPVGITYLPLPLGGLFTLFFVIEKIVYGTQQSRTVVTFDHELEAT